MALIEHDLFGNVVDKEAKAVEIAQMFCPEEGFYFAYSGGKDSTATKKILDIAGVMYDAYYNMTTVDPPELVRHIIRQFEAVIYEFSTGLRRFFRTDGCELIKCDESDLPKDRRKIIHFNIPEYPMRKLIVKKKIPPTRLLRYCCEVLKESNGVGRVVVTGVRKHESASRKESQGDVVIFAGKKAAQKMNANFTLTKRGGVVLNYDDSETHRVVENCYRTLKTLVNPIIDFTDDDVWEFIRKYNLPYCELYDEGWKRLGCVGCPMGNFASQRREFARWPQYRRMYVQAFQEMLDLRIAEGLTHNRLWTDGEGIMRWWTGCDQGNNPDQMSIDDLEEIT